MTIDTHHHMLPDFFWQETENAHAPVGAPTYAGTDFIVVRDGRIAAVYLFFDKLP